MKARLKWMRVTGLWRDQRIWFTLCSKVLEAFVVLQERPQIIRAGERLPAVPQHRGGGGQPWHSLFMDRSKLEMWQNKAYFTKTFRPVYIITFFKYLKSEMKRAGTKSPKMWHCLCFPKCVSSSSCCNVTSFPTWLRSGTGRSFSSFERNSHARSCMSAS